MGEGWTWLSRVEERSIRWQESWGSVAGGSREIENGGSLNEVRSLCRSRPSKSQPYLIRAHLLPSSFLPTHDATKVSPFSSASSLTSEKSRSFADIVAALFLSFFLTGKKRS